MIHDKRTFSIKPTTLEGIQKDADFTWCLCNGYSVEYNGDTYLLLNDSFTEDSVEEYAICKVLEEVEGGYKVKQLDSLTFGWVKPEELPAAIIGCFGFDGWSQTPFTVKAGNYKEHKCRLCA